MAANYVEGSSYGQTWGIAQTSSWKGWGETWNTSVADRRSHGWDLNSEVLYHEADMLLAVSRCSLTIYWWEKWLMATTWSRIEVQRETGHDIVKQVPSTYNLHNFTAPFPIRRNRQSWFPKVPVFRHVTPCRPVQMCSCFRGTCCLHHTCGSTVQRRHTFTKLYGVIFQTRYLLVNAINLKLHLIPGVHKFPQKCWSHLKTAGVRTATSSAAI